MPTVITELIRTLARPMAIMGPAGSQVVCSSVLALGITATMATDSTAAQVTRTELVGAIGRAMDTILETDIGRRPMPM